MNNTTKNKTSFNNFLFKSVFLSKNAISPKRDWIILIVLFIIFIITSICFDYYMYKKIISGDMYISVKREELVIENLKSNDLKNIQNNFEMKEINTINLKLKNLVDPSI